MSSAVKEMIHVEETDGHVYVSLRLNSHSDAWRLAILLLAGASRTDCSTREAARWRQAARELKKKLQLLMPKPKPSAVPENLAALSNRVQRPPARLSNAADRQRVIDGILPYPVLSMPDLRVVWPQLEKQGLSEKEIADRLHVSDRTIFRWRRNKRLAQEES